MNSDRNDCHCSLILYGHKDFGKFSRNLKEMVEKVIPTIVKQHLLFDRIGVTGVCVRFRLKSALGLLGEDGRTAGRVAKYLQQMGRNKMLVSP